MLSDFEIFAGELAMLTKREYKELYLLHYQKAKMGDVQSQFKLGVCYEHGNGVVQDYELAAFWYQKAIDGGHPLAELNLSWVQLKQTRTSQDYVDFNFFSYHSVNSRRLEESYNCLMLLSDGYVQRHPQRQKVLRH